MRLTIIEFYHTNPVLLNHCLSEYKDRNLKKMAMDKLTTSLNRSEEEIKNHWHSLKTVFDREDKKQTESSKNLAQVLQKCTSLIGNTLIALDLYEIVQKLMCKNQL